MNELVVTPYHVIYTVVVVVTYFIVLELNSCSIMCSCPVNVIVNLILCLVCCT